MLPLRYLPFLGWATYSFAQFSTSPRILIYSATREFRHDSIPTAIKILGEKGKSLNITFENTEDEAQFTDSILAGFDALLFLSNTGEVLGDAGKLALQKYLDLGGNFIGVHSASDCLRNTTFYGHEVGAFFDYHADLQNATINVLDSTHPSTSMLPSRWPVRDEMYNFKSDPRAIGATVVLSADESTYVDNGTRKFDQAWFQTHGAGVESGQVGGRSFYTSLGHLNETWMDDLFIGHVLGANTTRAFNSSALVGNPEQLTGPASGLNAPSTVPSSSPSPAPSSTSPTSSAALLFPCSNSFILAFVISSLASFL
ncbi:trehalose utilization-domain-containing protein [Infundibulicybe gibba]|nr:trehalose utilization-domain-containing protein [Infundibulicybe gibba]